MNSLLWRFLRPSAVEQLQRGIDLRQQPLDFRAFVDEPRRPRRQVSQRTQNSTIRSPFARPPSCCGSPAEIFITRNATNGCACRRNPHLRAMLAAHVALQFVDRRRLKSAHNIERDRLVSVTAQATDLKITVAGIESITQRRRRLRWSLVTQHPTIPRLAREPIGFLACLLGTFGRHADGLAE